MSNQEGSRHPGQQICELPGLGNPLKIKNKQSYSAVTLLHFLLMQLSCPMEAWQKEWVVHLKMFPHPSLPHFSDDPSIQPTSHYSGNTNINSMRASCPPLPRCSGSHTGLLEQEPARPDSPQMFPPPPWSSEPESSFPGPIVITKDLLGLKNVLEAEARRKHTSPLTSG